MVDLTKKDPIKLDDNKDLESRPMVKIDNGTTYEGQWRGDTKEGYGA